MNSAIIVAAGSGNRFGGEIPKQFVKINGKPIIIYTVEKFENCELVDEIVIVLAESEIENFKQLISKYKFKKISSIVVGGESRAASVQNGFQTLNPKLSKIVAIHDGARPLVKVEEISGTIKKAIQNGAACLVTEVTDTIKKVKADKILHTVDRNKLRRALTPQCFQYKLLDKVYKKIDVSEVITDECYLIEQMGYEIKIVSGSPQNIKITHQNDLIFAEQVLNQKN